MLPSLGHVGSFEDLSWTSQRNAPENKENWKEIMRKPGGSSFFTYLIFSDSSTYSFYQVYGRFLWRSNCHLDTWSSFLKFYNLIRIKRIKASDSWICQDLKNFQQKPLQLCKFSCSMTAWCITEICYWRFRDRISLSKKTTILVEFHVRIKSSLGRGF